MSQFGVPIQSTAGAVPVKDDKGKITMQKVKVSRYVSGKRPDYAAQESSDEDDFEFGVTQLKTTTLPIVKTDAEKEDRRLRRLQDRHREDDEDEGDEAEEDREDRVSRHRRRVQEPEVLENSDMEASDDDDRGRRSAGEEEEEEEEEELDEEEIERRRAALKQRMRQQREEEELMVVEEEKSEEGSDEESSEYEEYTDSEEEETGPRLKPVFVRKKDRITVQEREREEQKKRDLEIEDKRNQEERRRTTLKIVEAEARKEVEDARTVDEALEAMDTDDDNDEEEYEAWKVRELKRMKRDREKREAEEKEQMERERLRNMTEEERRLDLKNNPKVITNKASKGKYKFLQKYYHRGAFFMDEEEGVYSRDYSMATLDDQFDKTILPKVMQVKNFGRSGRTKYTHLVDQDTSQDSPWAAETAQNLKFSTSRGGGMKQVFERPMVKRRK